jgi:hypothetical protein
MFKTRASHGGMQVQGKLVFMGILNSLKLLQTIKGKLSQIPQHNIFHIMHVQASLLCLFEQEITSII